MTFLGEPPQTEPRGGGNKKEKKSILDNQGKIETTILRLFVICGNNVKQIDIPNTFKSYALC